MHPLCLGDDIPLWLIVVGDSVLISVMGNIVRVMRLARYEPGVVSIAAPLMLPPVAALRALGGLLRWSLFLRLSLFPDCRCRDCRLLWCRVVGTEPYPRGPEPLRRALVVTSEPRLEEGVLSGVHMCLLIAPGSHPHYAEF